MLQGLGFTSQQLTEAATQVVDAQAIEAALTGLAEEAHGAAVSARARLADMTFKVAQSLRCIVSNPATDPALRTQVRDTGSALSAQFQGLRSARQSRRDTTTELRDLQEELEAEQKKTRTHDTEEARRTAQKDLRLKKLSGEPLRPEDLVLAPETAPQEEPQPTPKKRRRPRRS